MQSVRGKNSMPNEIHNLINYINILLNTNAYFIQFNSIQFNSKYMNTNLLNHFHRRIDLHHLHFLWCIFLNICKYDLYPI